eukprot:g13321.t1
MLWSSGGRIAMLVLMAGGMACVRAAVATNGTCSVCRGVTQGFVDLHAEWTLLREMQMGASSFSRDDQRVGTDDVDVLLRGDTEAITYEMAIDRFCSRSFLSSNQQRVCYSIIPFAAEIGKWLHMGMPPERVCRKLGTRNPETCFDARDAERPSDSTRYLLDRRTRPNSIPEGVDCFIEHRSSLSPRWVLLD